LTAKQLLLVLLGLTLLVLIIYHGGNYLSNLADKSYRKTIDKYGTIVKATVTKKKYLKGRYVVFSYEYKGRKYSNKEQNRDYYSNLTIGEQIEIKIDTTNPEDSYIFATGYRIKFLSGYYDVHFQLPVTEILLIDSLVIPLKYLDSSRFIL